MTVTAASTAFLEALRIRDAAGVDADGKPRVTEAASTAFLEALRIRDAAQAFRTSFPC